MHNYNHEYTPNAAGYLARVWAKHLVLSSVLSSNGDRSNLLFYLSTKCVLLLSSELLLYKSNFTCNMSKINATLALTQILQKNFYSDNFEYL